MIDKMKFSSLVFLGAALVMGAQHAKAAYSWNFVNDSYSCTTCGGVGNSWTFSDTFDGSTVNVDVTAWSDTGSGGTINEAELMKWSGGLGVDNHDYSYDAEWQSPNHSIDNRRHMDSVLFDFGEHDVALNHLRLGWWTNDSDVTVLAYTGTADIDFSTSSLNYSDLTSSSDWTTFNLSDVNYSRSFNNDADPANNIASSIWLVGALDTRGDGKDYFKVKSLSGSTHIPPNGCEPNCGNGEVPEPAPLALMMLGLAGLGYSRRHTLLRK